MGIASLHPSYDLLSGTHRPMAPSPLAGEGGERGSIHESKSLDRPLPLTWISRLRAISEGEGREPRHTSSCVVGATGASGIGTVWNSAGRLTGR